uniref:Bacteriophage Gp15 protein n=1 Tax=Myoviridae sp. ctlD98 TaxID=2827705 RepID=A0A8S5S9C9_9CAUD|nr:MAG TPA: hypothetical protein [Myoviridae sp. ctlD98]
MLDPLPTQWNGFEINTSFRIGIQTFILEYDKELSDYEKSLHIVDLMFDDRPHPYGEELQECITWFLNGWFHDKSGSSKDNRRLVDYDIDQWRIYADFRKIYGIDLSLDEMHWWTFNGLLWNMPYKQSAFMEVINIRKKKIEAKMSVKEKEAIAEAQKVYGLDQPETEYTEDEKSKIDDYDRMMEEIRKKKATEKEALKQFRK